MERAVSVGGHLVKRLKREGFWVRGVDLKFHEYVETEADDFVVGDLRDQSFCRSVIDTKFDEVYRLAADMGGAGFVFTGKNDADIMHNSATINLNVLDACHKRNNKRIFYSSSACMYPERNQINPDNAIVWKIRLTQQRLTANTDGRSYLVNGSIWRTSVIMAYGSISALSQHFWP